MASKTNRQAAMPPRKKTAMTGETAAHAKASAKPKGAASVTGRAQAKAAPAKASVEAKPSGASRRDGAGHLDPTYAADLHAMSLASAEDHTVDRAFLRRSKTLRAPLAKELGREAVMTMTSAEDQSDQLQDVELELGEEIGGPIRSHDGRSGICARQRSVESPRSHAGALPQDLTRGLAIASERTHAPEDRSRDV